MALLFAFLAILNAAGQVPPVVAVAEFSTVGTASAHLLRDLESPSAQLVRILVGHRIPGLRILPVDQVHRVARELGFRPEELYIWTGRAAAVARAAGASWIVTGRWTHLDLDGLSLPAGDSRVPAVSLAHAALQVRVVEATTQRILLEETFAATRADGRGTAALVEAVEAVLLRAARRIAGLLASSTQFDGPGEGSL
ncbi:MAG: hypothetical protein QN172_09915 [Armatimonadota bacterium]|nr:hypothetical protein [Armatimonadota bacterium]MDR7439317.1 hypothetical protein [Armatimonadota bacterium]MDR7562007.1 hypothetical protein [Armatimonadota bacterium]MDR7567019.1 hypothetical protein [Armatimonadota bacterium]MDR7602755.1 hypothetical protein [Armatimonadota bacterium]